jgi:hypothetical protein
MAVVTQIQVRRGTASQWTSTNPVLAAGEWGYESDTGKVKIGNGSSAWNSIGYIGATSGTVTSITAGTGLSGGTITSTGTIAIDSTVATLTGSQTLTNKTLTAPVISTISNTGTVTLPTATTTLVGTDTTDTLTNKTLTTPTITQGQSTPSFTTNAYTLIAGDAGKLLLASNSATAGTVYIPTDATTNFATGTQITILQTGSGQLTVQATTPGTTTLYSTGTTSTAPKCRAQYSAITIIKTAANTWYAIGDQS